MTHRLFSPAALVAAAALFALSCSSSPKGFATADAAARALGNAGPL